MPLEEVFQIAKKLIKRIKYKLAVYGDEEPRQMKLVNRSEAIKMSINFPLKEVKS